MSPFLLSLALLPLVAGPPVSAPSPAPITSSLRISTTTLEPAPPLLPPRPNRGPEPWPSTPRGEAWWILPSAGLIAITTLLVLATRRFLRAHPRPGSSRLAELESLEPRARSILAGSLLREALVARFGAVWAARTTEEIAADPQLLHALGTEPTASLVRWLSLADLCKFARQPETLPDRPDPRDEIPALIQALRDRQSQRTADSVSA